MVRQERGVTGRPVNIDPGYLTASALVMATAKDFAHRIPLAGGIYAHLEFLFTRTGVRTLDWTYPDLRREPAQGYLRAVGRDLPAAASGTPGLKPGSGARPIHKSALLLLSVSIGALL